MLIRWIKRLGGTVLGTCSTPDKEAIARAAGADPVGGYADFVAAGRALTCGRGVDLVIDGVGAGTLDGDLEVVRDRGHVVFYGWAGGEPPPVPPTALVPRSVTLSGFSVPTLFGLGQASVGRRAGRVFAGLAEGWLRPRVEAVYPLHDAATAHRRLEARATSGKR